MLSQDVVESAEKRVGETIGGKWHLDRVIGVGGMAAVYEATHRNRNRVAIKLLHPPLSLEEGTRQRFLREGYVANTIRHDGAVRVLDDDVTEDGIAFLVMELLKGESVEERLMRKGGLLSVVESLTIAEQLLEVLEAAHDQNVVHRDIKPDNLFLTDEGKLKILDFGIARLSQGNTRTTKVGSFMGTPAFCAQEQARGRWDEVDHRTDLYSVGATLFTCLTGEHVHQAETSSEQLALAIGATARSLADVMPQAPKELVDLVDLALAYDKEDRFQTARAMRAAVKRVKAGLPVEKKLSTPAPPSASRTFGPGELDPDSMRPGLWEGPKRTRVIFGVAAAAILAVLIFVASKPGEPAAKETIDVPPAGSREPSSGNVEGAVPPAPPLDAPEPEGEPKGALGEEAEPRAWDENKPTVKSAPPPRPKPPPAPAEEPAPKKRTPPQAASFPAPSPNPSPAVDGGDEGMFDKRF